VHKKKLNINHQVNANQNYVEMPYVTHQVGHAKLPPGLIDLWAGQIAY